MYLYRKFSVVLAQAVSLLIIFLSTGAAAADQSLLQLYSISKYNVKITLESVGQAQIEQNILFSAPSALNWKFYSDTKRLQVYSDNQLIDQRDYQLKRSGASTRLITQTTGLSWRVVYSTNLSFVRHEQRDQVFIKLIENSNFTLDDIKIQLIVNDLQYGEISGNLYALNSVQDPQGERISDRAINFTAKSMGIGAVSTLSASWPKNAVFISGWQKVKLNLINLEVIPWLILGFIFPIVSLLVILRIYRKNRRAILNTTDILTAPPQKISPLIVGVLIHKKIYPKVLVALIIDLCQRGYLVIVHKNRGYYLGIRRALDENLEVWEKDIISQLFTRKELSVSTDDLIAQSRQLLYNPAVRRAFAKIYETVTEIGYFNENPHFTRAKYKLVAMALYFSALIGAFWVALANQSSYLLLPIAGTMLAGQLIIRLTPSLVSYSIKGNESRQQWLAYANYLSLRSPLSITAAQNHIFEDHLPYAIALDVANDWALRFDLSRVIITQPEWWISFEEGSTRQFAQTITEFTQQISKVITQMKGPSVN